MKELLKKLDKLAEKYHKKQMRINNRADPEFYLYMGKSNGIGEAIDMIKETLVKLPIAKISDEVSVETINALEEMFKIASKNEK